MNSNEVEGSIIRSIEGKQVIDINKFDAEHSLDDLARVLSEHESLDKLCIMGDELDRRPISHAEIGRLMEAIEGHSNLTKMCLPRCWASTETDTRMIRHFSDSPKLVLLNLQLGFILSRSGMPSPGIRLDLYERDNVTIRLEVFQELTKMPNLMSLKIPTPLMSSEGHRTTLRTLINLTNDPMCNISQMSFATKLSRQDLENLSNYEKLTELSMAYVNADQLRFLFPLSQLEKVTFHCITSTGIVPRDQTSHILNGLADFLIAQPKLKILRLAEYVVNSDEDPFALHESTESAIPHLTQAVKTHESLHSLKLHPPFEIGKQVSHGIYLALSAALPHNSRVKKLDLSLRPWDLKARPDLLPAGVHLQELLLDLNRMDMDQVKDIASWVDKNMSIIRITRNDLEWSLLHRPPRTRRYPRPLTEALTKEYNKIRKVLTRNKLAQHVNNATYAHPAISITVWPQLLAKLGSNGHEGTPVFVFLRNNTTPIGTFRGPNLRRDSTGRFK